MLIRCVLAGSVLLVMGCATDPTPSQLLVSSRLDTFVLPTPVEILATNTSDRPLFMHPCFQQERRAADGSWQAVANPECTPIDGFILVKAGATDSLVMAWISAPGTYRIGINYSSDSTSVGSPKVSFSNGFAVAQ